jgi:beta-lactamase regulating signal transducer with metallopeptidase domain
MGFFIDEHLPGLTDSLHPRLVKDVPMEYEHEGWNPMDLGLVVQLFLGVLWLLGCVIFVTFLVEFREDMFARPNYSARANATRTATGDRKK